MVSAGKYSTYHTWILWVCQDLSAKNAVLFFFRKEVLVAFDSGNGEDFFCWGTTDFGGK